MKVGRGYTEENTVQPVAIQNQWDKFQTEESVIQRHTKFQKKKFVWKTKRAYNIILYFLKLRVGNNEGKKEVLSKFVWRYI